MSLTINQEEVLQDLREDFDFFLKQEKWSDCENIIESVGDMGSESEATYLHHELNRAKAHQSNEEEDLAAGHEDSRDVADRTNY